MPWNPWPESFSLKGNEIERICRGVLKNVHQALNNWDDDGWILEVTITYLIGTIFVLA
jgi:hypothetical protein